MSSSKVGWSLQRCPALDAFSGMCRARSWRRGLGIGPKRAARSAFRQRSCTASNDAADEDQNTFSIMKINFFYGTGTLKNALARESGRRGRGSLPRDERSAPCPGWRPSGCRNDGSKSGPRPGRRRRPEPRNTCENGRLAVSNRELLIMILTFNNNRFRFRAPFDEGLPRHDA